MRYRFDKDGGRWIDRGQPVRFRFEGREYEGFAGDTVSSALWANGVKVLGRSFKYHRPRGVYSHSGADSNVMLETTNEINIRGEQVTIADQLDVRAVNTRGGVANDFLKCLDLFGAFTPVGFYYKAFHTPKKLFPFYENRMREVAGLGRVNTSKRAEATPKTYGFCDVLVIGGGPSGMAAAVAAAELGADVMLVDENRELGGSMLYQRPGDTVVAGERQQLVDAVTAHDRINVRLQTRVAACYSDQWVALVDAERLTKVRARAVVMAPGVYEQPAVFRGNDLPGVMLLSCAQRLIHLFAVKPCERAIIVTANDEGYNAAIELHELGVEVAAIVDWREAGPHDSLAQAVQELGIPVRLGEAPYEAVANSNKTQVGGLTLCRSADGGGTTTTIACDAVLMSVGVTPADGLLRQAGVHMRYDENLEQFLPFQIPEGTVVAGQVNGIHALADRVADGKVAGAAAAHAAGVVENKPDTLPPARPRQGRNHPYPIIDHPSGKNFVDLDEDLQVKDFTNAIQEGFDSAELLKRYSTVGMGPSQGKHSNLAATRILARARREPMVGKQLTTARPFVLPVPISHLAGRTFTPRRRTAQHIRHEEAGAKFMFAGTWLRPEYFPQAGKDRAACIADEAMAVRQRVGLIDLGTLGKIEVNGPDAAEFLERMYTGRFAKLAVGMTRYGLMCDETGVVIDDGVIARLADDRFYVSTTTSGSDSVYREFQRWAMIWGLDVTLANLTNHVTAMNLAGPESLKLLAAHTDVDLGAAAFPYLAVREGTVAGVPARFSRVGFVGELGCEIHVPADRGLFVWDTLMAAGKELGIRPFGVEAQRLLRLEKGHIIVGQDSDGLSQPYELGMGWAVKMKKPFFVGQRSLKIHKAKGLTRQLVGFTLPDDAPLPKECHLVLDRDDIVGRVTSVVRSPSLGKTIGLAYVRPDQATAGTAITIRVDGGRLLQGTVADTPFYDPENQRQQIDEPGD